MSPRTQAGLLRRLRVDERAVAAVEFALVLPVLLIIYLGGYETIQAICAYRKLSSTTNQIASVISQYTTMSATDFSTVMGATSQIMSPYPTSNLAVTVTEISTDATSKATVTWSEAYNGGSALSAGASYTLPSGIIQPSTSYIYVQTSYLWVPVIQFAQFGNVTLTDSIYMLPRDSAAIPYTG